MLFWLLSAAMTGLAAAFVLVPLLRARPTAGPTGIEANLEVLRGHRREIDADIAAGTLPADAREEALADLVGRAADDLARAEEAPAAAPRKPWPLAAGVAVALPLLAFGLYLAIGAPHALRAAPAAAAAPKLDEKQIVAMVESLAARMKERPGDAKGWGLLARSMASLGRFEESAAAYAELAKLAPADPDVLADYADALAMAQGQKLAGKPAELARQALRLDPRHQKALALAATAAMEAGDPERALEHWRAIAVQLPAGSRDAAEVDRIIDEVRLQASAAARGPALGVSGQVALAPEIAARLSGSETVFVFARAEGGERGPPLAVLRASARELPLKFAMDDSHAMVPGRTISSAGSVRIEARVSRSGEAAARSGDFVGASVPVKPGAREVKVVIDRALP